MSLPSLPNLTAHLITLVPAPESIAFQRPGFASKDAYRAWCNNPQTIGYFLGMAVGQNPNMRVSKDNPATHLKGLIVDYDAQPPEDLVGLIVANAPADLRPSFVCRTFSGNCRLIYIFSEPIPIFNDGIKGEFLKKAQRELKLRGLLPGFEPESFHDASHYFEIGSDWQAIPGGTSIAQTLLMGWVELASGKHRWDKDGPNIPIDVIRAGLKKLWPDGWPGGWDRFELGARGPRFWDPTASTPGTCIVRESGLQFFSDGGGHKLYLDLLGADFIRQASENKIGAAIIDLWFDGEDYWRNLPDGQWKSMKKGDAGLHLYVAKHLSKKSPHRDEPTEIDRALHSVQTLKPIKAALPFIFRPDGLYVYNGALYLNVSTLKPIQPVPDRITIWGDGFPRSGRIMGTFLNPADQFDYLITWVSLFYKGALNQCPEQGLALFLAGPTGSGKTFFLKAILGPLMGGRQDAGKYLLSDDKYNDKLLAAPVWNIDDGIVSSDPKQRAVFSQVVKRLVANDTVTMRAMYHSGEDVEWPGRVVVCMNDDPSSLQVLPDTDINILDKISLMMTKLPDVTEWPSDEIVRRELPYFAAYLRDYTPPAHVIPPPNKARFGVLPYRHEVLLQAARSFGETGIFEALFDLWRRDHFAVDGPGQDCAHWAGEVHEFINAMRENVAMKSVVERKFLDPGTVGKILHVLLRRPLPYLHHNYRTWTIDRPVPLPAV